MKNHPRPILVGPLIFRITFYLSRHSIFYPTRILMHERSRSKMQKNRGSYVGAVPFALVTTCSGLVLVAPASTTPGCSSKARDSAHVEYTAAEDFP